MKKLGIVGGIGPEATIDYYRMIIELCLIERQNYPEIIVYSINMNKMLDMTERGDLDELVQYLLTALDALKNAGADFAIIASNTPHMVFDTLQEESPLDLLSIVEATCKKAILSKMRRLLLLGTKFTMKSSFYRRVFSREGIEIVVPEDNEIEYIHDRIFKELELGNIVQETKTRILEIVSRIKQKEGIEGVILGCTELPLMFPEDELGINFLNTSRIHVESALTRMVES